jgi:GT2 family glycosyltransferase
MVDVSVIVVTRNTCAQTLEAIASVFSGRDALAKEVFVVDNGSRDDSPQTIPARFPAVRYDAAGCNLGFARAVNRAAHQATGEWLLLLNSDARLQPETLATAMAWMRAHPDSGVAGAQLLNPDGSRQNSIANYPTLATELLNKSLLRRLFPRRFPGKEQSFSEPVDVETVVGAFFLVRRQLWDALGGLDERYFFFLEETDFCLETRKAGYRVVHLPDVKVWHGQGQTARQAPAGARIEYWRSRYAYFLKHRGRLVSGGLRFGLLLRLLVNTLGTAALTAVTLGRVPKWRQKCGVCLAIGGWHLRGCPAGVGLPR